MRLRPTLLAVMSMMVAAPMVSLAVVAWQYNAAAARDLAVLLMDSHARTITVELRRLVEAPTWQLDKLAGLIERRALPIDDWPILAEHLAGELGALPTFTWMSFGDARDGSFTGIRRDAEGLVVNRSDPADGGIPQEYRHSLTGWRPLPAPTDRPYDARRTGWFAAAEARDSLWWSAPYRFNEGGHGITAALAVRRRPPGEGEASRLLGVLTADVALDRLEALMDGLDVGPGGRAVIRVGTGPDSLTIGGRARPLPCLLHRALATRMGEAPAVRSQDDCPPVAPDWLPPLVADLLYGNQAVTLRVLPVGVAGLESWQVVLMAPDADAVRPVEAATLSILVLAALALGIALVVGGLVSGMIAGPINALSNDLRRISALELTSWTPPPSRIVEVQTLSEAVARMKAALKSFMLYVPVELVREVIESGQPAELSGERRVMTIFMSDIADFTRIAAQLPPERIVAALGDYLERVHDRIHAAGGTVDKFMGDGVLAMFNAPRRMVDHARRAVDAALDVRRMNDATGGETGSALFRTRIGLASGEVVVGNIGTPRRFSFTVIGDAVNLASRLESLGKVYGVDVIADGTVAAEAGPGFLWRRLDRVVVAGQSRAIDILEALGAAGAVPGDRLEAAALYESALAAYFRRDFATALAGWRDALTARPGDAAAAVMAERARRMLGEPPPEDWNGAWIYATK